MAFFKRNKASGLAAVSDKVAGGIAGAINKTQHRWVRAMERLSARLSMKAKVIVLCSYLTLMFFACGYIIVKSILNWKEHAVTEARIKMPEPKLQHPTVMGQLSPDPIQNRIVAFRKLLDSLSKTEEGKLKKDTLLKTRPGLLDSIKLVEQMYQ